MTTLPRGTKNMKIVKFETEANQEQHLQASFDRAFLSACENGNLHDFNQLVELLPAYVVIQMIKANNHTAFRMAASSGHLPVLDRLMELAPEDVSLMIEAERYAAFTIAAGCGHLSVLNRLVELAPDRVSLMIKSGDYGDFCDYSAFRMAASRGHLPVLDRLVELAPELASLMIAANGYAALSSLALNHMDDFVNRALCDPGVFAHAEMHQHEYAERYVNPFIQNELSTLRAMKTTFERANPNAVFNIADEAQAARCFYMIRNLIRRNQPCIMLALLLTLMQI